MPVLCVGIRQREKEGSRIRAIQMNNLMDFLGIWRIDKILNPWVKVFCGVEKRIDKSILWCLLHMKGMENSKIALRIYKGGVVRNEEGSR